MYNISTLNKISKVGLKRFSSDYNIVAAESEIRNSDGVIVRSHKMHDMDFDDKLLAIARAGAGVNNIPLDKCSAKGIVVFNTPGANANAVKELVIGCMIIALRNIDGAFLWTESILTNNDNHEEAAKAIEKGKSKFAGSELQGKTIGVIGLGAIGAMVANAANSLGMKVLGYDPYLSVRAALHLDSNITVIDDLKEMVSASDLVTLHLPALESTSGLVNANLLESFKDNSILLNFSRDKLVVEDDIVKAIESGKLAKYVTDFATPKLLGKPNMVLTPHLGASTQEAEDNCAIMAANQMMDYFENGNISNSVNFPNVSLARTDNCSRYAVITQGVEDPIKLVMGSFKDCRIAAVSGATRAEYGYVLLDICSGDVSIDSISEDGILRIRKL